MKVIMCLFDKKAEMYMQPFFVPAVGVGLRQLADEMRPGKESLLQSHPEDFDVYTIGNFAEDVAIISPKVMFVLNCASLVTKED